VSHGLNGFNGLKSAQSVQSVANYLRDFSPITEHLRRRIRQEGPLSFRDFMEATLYHPQLGYYSSTRNPIGREGDFYTSSDLDPVLGKLLARKFAAIAEEFGIAPHSFAIVELGAGRGLLARDILQHERFPYFIVERSAAMRDRQRESLRGLDVEWLDDLPHNLTGCVFSNEFFDALPVHRVVRRNGVLREIYVTEDLHEVEGDLQAPMDAPVPEGYYAEINLDAREWMHRIGASLRQGRHLAIDYGYLEREFYARPHGTLMCYWRHQAVENPYIRIGEQDITTHVNFSDLMQAGRDVSLETVGFATQMDFLVGLGILDELKPLVESGTAESLQRVEAIKKLIVPGNMGERFKVLVQQKR
jgi:SAM-dependent MidA family methyltransferase